MKTCLKYLLLSVLLLFGFSCNDLIDENYNRNRPEYSPEMIGKLHNELLGDLDKQLYANDEYKTIDEFSSIQINLSKDLFLNRLNKNLDINPKINELIYNSNRDVYLKAKEETKSQIEANDELAQGLLDECKELLANQTFINSVSWSEGVIIKDIINSFAIYESTKDLNVLKGELKKHRESIDNSYFDPAISDGYLALIILSIAEYSIEYWTNDINSKYEGNSKFVWWVVSDAVGAVIGAGQSMLQDAANGEDVDWTDAAISGLFGGVIGSLPGGKALGKAIKKLF